MQSMCSFFCLGRIYWINSIATHLQCHLNLWLVISNLGIKVACLTTLRFPVTTRNSVLTVWETAASRSETKQCRCSFSLSCLERTSTPFFIANMCTHKLLAVTICTFNKNRSFSCQFHGDKNLKPTDLVWLSWKFVGELWCNHLNHPFEWCGSKYIDLTWFHTNAFSKVSVFIAAKTKHNTSSKTMKTRLRMC